MSNNIWQKLQESKKPFFVLAPMDDVTDTVFRQIVVKHAPADLMMTEFANADGWCSPGKKAIAKRLKKTPAEKPLIAQIWGIEPQHYYKMAQDMVELGFDGVDINMGCPVKEIIKKGACSALIENQPLANEIILATQEGLSGKIPLSVKTRIGFNNIDTENWISFLLNHNLNALIVHGRTKKDQSKVPAKWQEIKKAVELRNKLSPHTIIVGNGDVLTKQEGLDRAKESGVDGIMVGRGIFQNLFVFSDNQQTKDLSDMLVILKEHVLLHQKTWGKNGEYRFEPLKKFVKMYVHGFANAAEVRANLMQAKSHAELINSIDNLLSKK